MQDPPGECTEGSRKPVFTGNRLILKRAKVNRQVSESHRMEHGTTNARKIIRREIGTNGCSLDENPIKPGNRNMSNKVAFHPNGWA